MLRQQILGMFLTLAGSGCSILSSSTQVIPQTFQPATDDADLDQPFLSEFDPSAKHLSQTDLRAGQYVEVLPIERHITEKGQPEGVRHEMTHHRYVGRVAFFDGQNVILSDAVEITEGRSTHRVPILSKVPYMSRMFSNSGVARTSSRIPEDVIIPRDRIARAFELSPSGVETLQELQQFERIGVDFD